LRQTEVYQPGGYQSFSIRSTPPSSKRPGPSSRTGWQPRN